MSAKQLILDKVQNCLVVPDMIVVPLGKHGLGKFVRDSIKAGSTAKVVPSLSAGTDAFLTYDNHKFVRIIFSPTNELMQSNYTWVIFEDGKALELKPNEKNLVR